MVASSSSTSGTVAFSGLVSGLNTQSIISSLVSAAEASESQYTAQQSTLSDQQSAISSISSSLSSLGTFAQSLEIPSATQLMTATSSDSHISVAVSGDAQAGVHSMRVDQIATAQTVASNTFATDTAGIAGTGSFTIASGTGSSATSATISFDSTDTLDSIAGKINEANVGVTASVLNDGSTYRLIVNSTQPGTANAATFTDDSGSSLGLANSANITVAAKDAKVNIDGIEVTRGSNIIDDALPGTTLTLSSAQASSDPNTAVTVSTDTTGLTSLLNSFVSNYNAISSALDVQMSYNQSSTTQEPLFGDSTMRQLQGSLETIASQEFGGLNLTDLGITIDENGNMSLDSDKLTAALQTNPNAVTQLFTTGGFANAVYQMTDMYTDPADGILTSKSQSITDQNTDLQNEIDQIQSNATALQDRLQDEFNQLESTMSGLQSEGNYVSKMLTTSTS
ncbi:MAG TPA: flagellar filament capping protein FliD [Kofleriaceae bacterium]|jgi:flagellar hook-associated protein 2